MGNTQEELEASVLLGSYNLVAITETWREKSDSWSVAVDGYRMLRRDRLGRSLRECHPWQQKRDRVWKAVSEEQPQAGWRHNGKRNKRSREPVAWSREAHWGSLLAPGGIALTGSCPAGGLQSPQNLLKKCITSYFRKRLLDCMEDSFLRHIILTRGDAILDLLVTNLSELISDDKIRESLGHRICTLLVFAALRDMEQAKRTFRILNFGTAHFWLFKELNP